MTTATLSSNLMNFDLAWLKKSRARVARSCFAVAADYTSRGFSVAWRASPANRPDFKISRRDRQGKRLTRWSSITRSGSKSDLGALVRLNDRGRTPAGGVKGPVSCVSIIGGNAGGRDLLFPEQPIGDCVELFVRIVVDDHPAASLRPV